MQLLLAMDDAAAEWYAYHFHDTLFLNDTSWIYWHVRLQQILNDDQLQGRACAFCSAALPDLEQKTSKDAIRMPKRHRSLKNSLQTSSPAKAYTQHIAGYTIKCCREPCHISLE